MAIVNKKIAQTDTVLLTVPNGSRFAITTILVCNTASAVMLSASPNGGWWSGNSINNGTTHIFSK